MNYTHSIVHLLDNKTHTMTNQLTQQQKTKFKKISNNISHKYSTTMPVIFTIKHIAVKCYITFRNL